MNKESRQRETNNIQRNKLRVLDRMRKEAMAESIEKH